MTPLVIDDVLLEPMRYREACLAQPFRSHELAQDVVFHGIGKPPNRLLPEYIELRRPALRVVTSLLRLSPLGQSCPNYVHTDTDMGEVTGIFYLNPDPPAEDGTAFYRHRASGREVSIATDAMDRIEEGFEWRDIGAWERIEVVSAKFNRLVLFPAGAYHSRALFGNYGTTEQDARLIQICFCTGTL